MLWKHVSTPSIQFTAATLVIFAELDWTPGCLEQGEDRAHRIFQTSMLHIHYLVAKGTLDEWVWSALERKVHTGIINLLWEFLFEISRFNIWGNVQVRTFVTVCISYRRLWYLPHWMVRLRFFRWIQAIALKSMCWQTLMPTYLRILKMSMYQNCLLHRR